MKEVYKKTSIASFAFGIALAIFIVSYYFLFYKRFSEDREILLTTGLLIFFSLIAGFHYKRAYEKLKNKMIEHDTGVLDLENLHELNLQRIPSFLLKMVNVDSSGNPVFKIEPSKGQLSKWLTFFELFEKGFFIPVTYLIKDMNDRQIAIVGTLNTLKRAELSLSKPNGELIATFIQQTSKSILKNRGTLYNADGTIWRELVAKSMAGDIDVKDAEGMITASYRFGIFPYALHPAFQATADHEHVHFGTHISPEEKLAYTMIFFFWLKG
ncbi:hypothetical protein FITA111629_13940 [Filibacter tadaridae]|uniref:Uncharacterized protein n=1 Tax=Filibacter tadaridae TaxID=2483811 RepID=A0A3P5X2B6_9BACL|nr:hypothetical protein [Filibacter tadaridae]VDC22387.1 hypothetical protein FILTAD_00733 [Filibacter tadaridae]